VARNRAEREDAVGALIDYLTGSADENAQHVIARRAFLDAFLGDPQVGELLRRWEDETQPWVLKRYLEIVIDGEKAHYWETVLDPEGKRNLDLWNTPLALESQPSPATYDVSYCGGVIERALRAASDQGNDPTFGPEPAWPDFVTEAKDFVVGLGLPYPWLVIALLGEFGRRYLDALDIVTCPTSDHGCGNVPPRLLREYERLEAATASAGAPVPHRVSNALERWAEWFYRREVRKDSIRSIAQAAFDAERDRRKDVRDGIARVKELFDLTVHGIPE
jgi:hypothetical protein